MFSGSLGLMLVVCSQCGLLLKDCLALGPPQSVQLSRCPDNDFDIDKREKVGKREAEKEKRDHIIHKMFTEVNLIQKTFA